MFIRLSPPSMRESQNTHELFSAKLYVGSLAFSFSIFYDYAIDFTESKIYKFLPKKPRTNLPAVGLNSGSHKMLSHFKIASGSES